MDWKRQIYIYQSRQTRGKLKLSWKSSVTCHWETALYPTAGKGKASGQVQPAGPRGTGGPRSVSAHQGVRLVVLSEASLTLEVQHILPKEAEEKQLGTRTITACVRSAWSGEVNRERSPSTAWKLASSHSLVPPLTGECTKESNPMVLTVVYNKNFCRK